MDTTKWSIPKSDWLHSLQPKTGSSIQLAKTRPGADCVSNHQLLIAKFRLKLKKVRKTTGSFRYDLNQIPYDYTVEVVNRFKGLDLVDRVPKELWMEVCNIAQETVTRTIPKKFKKAKCSQIKKKIKKKINKNKNKKKKGKVFV